jgi:hypothetical protein
MAVAELIKKYIAEQYGDGNCVTASSGDSLGAACMTNTLKTPLPTGYTKDDICTEEVITWAYNNVGWCITATTGFLTVTTSPVEALGASIDIDGKDCGTTPVVACVVPVGTRKTVTITKTGYQTETRTGVTITEGVTTNLGTITLTLGTGATIAIGSNPGYCSYWIDKNPDVDAADGVTQDSYRLDVTNIIEREVSAPGDHTVIYRKDRCVDDEKTKFCVVRDAVYYEFLGDLECEDPTYFGTVSVTAHKMEAQSESIPAIVHIGSDYKFIAKDETAVFKVETPQGGSKSVTVYVTSEGRASWTKKITVSDGGTYAVDALMEPQKVVISIVAGESYIGDFGGAKHQMWFIGEIKRPSGDNWVEVDTLYAGTFYARLYFEDRTGSGKTPPPDIYTEKKVIIPGQIPSQRRLYWPYTQAGVATEYEIKEAYVGEWILWADLIEIT